MRGESVDNRSVPSESDEHNPTLEYGLISTLSSEPSTLQSNLTGRRLSELSDTQHELISSCSENNESNVDFRIHAMQQDSGMVSDSSKRSHNGMRLNLQERVDGEISEVNHNVHFNADLSPISLSDDSPPADINDTNVLLKRAQEANWLSFFSSKEEEGSLKDTEWHSLQSSIMQVISRPEPLGIYMYFIIKLFITVGGQFNPQLLIHSIHSFDLFTYLLI